MQSLYDLSAPAKLNLFLHVVGRRADGYHLLESVFRLIDWCDTLHIERRSDGNLTREDLGTPLPPNDLILRAARALQVACGCRWGAHIAIEKRIPSEAGLGGGSSDAATTLLALNRLWNLNLDLQSLLKIGLTLGADVPFFLNGQNAFVTGIGDILTPIDLPPARYLVAKPDAGLATQAIFSHPNLKRDSDHATMSSFAESANGFGRNDLQDVAQALCPDISVVLAWLNSKGLSGRMSGSGSASFALLQSDVVIDALPCKGHVRVCSGLPAHPLMGWAN